MQGEAVAQFACEQYFKNVCGNIEADTNRKDNQPLLKSEFGGEDSGSTQPEHKNTGIKGVDEETAGEYFHDIPFAEFDIVAISICAQGDFFKEEIKHAHGYKESAAYIAYHMFVFHHLCYQGRESVTNDNKDDITDPHTGHKTKAACMAIIKALFNNGKDYRPNRQGKNTPKH